MMDEEEVNDETEVGEQPEEETAPAEAPAEEAPAEEPAEEAPAEEPAEEAPAEEPAEEAPAEEPAEEAPVEEPAEEAPAEEPAEEAPAEELAEEAPAEEPAEEAPAEEPAEEGEAAEPGIGIPEDETGGAEEAAEEPAEEPAEEAPAEEPAGESGDEAGANRVLFLCTGNSCRSQMAEGILRHLAAEGFESLSAGSQPAEAVHPMAISVMAEIGVDISAQQPKSMDVFLSGDQPAPDVVISVCEKAAAECPALTGGAVNSMSLPFDDPAAAEGSDEEKLEVFRRVRDEISETLKMALGIGG